jgi:hypothetical protein
VVKPIALSDVLTPKPKQTVSMPAASTTGLNAAVHRDGDQ